MCLQKITFGIQAKMIQLAQWAILISLIKRVFCNLFLIIYKKWVNAIPLKKLTIKKNRDVILNRAKDYHENDKERLRKQPRDKHRNLFEEKNEKRKYGRNWYHNMCPEK